MSRQYSEHLLLLKIDPKFDLLHRNPPSYDELLFFPWLV